MKKLLTLLALSIAVTANAETIVRYQPGTKKVVREIVSEARKEVRGRFKLAPLSKRARNKAFDEGNCTCGYISCEPLLSKGITAFLYPAKEDIGALASGRCQRRGGALDIPLVDKTQATLNLIAGIKTLRDCTKKSDYWQALD